MKIDRSANLEFQDYRDTLAAREAEPKKGADDSIPDLQPYVAPASENLKPMPLVSVSVNQTIPLRDVLFELAEQADYDLELDPRISGSIIYTARNRPLDQVVDRISEIAGLRYKFDDDILRVELDTPYSKNYKIDYLNVVRTSKSSITTDVQVDTGEGSATGSRFTVDNAAENDFWKSLDENLKQILASNATGNPLRTQKDPAIGVASANPPPPPVEALPPVPPLDESALNDVKTQAGEEPAAAAAAPADAAAPATAAPAEAAPADTAPVSAPDVTLQVQSLPIDDPAQDGQSANTVAFTPTHSFNKAAGIISVYANDRLHKKVDEYLQMLHRAMTAQVLIEAKVLEVSLSDEFATGIDWSLLDDTLLKEFNLDVTATMPTLSAGAPSASFSLGYTGNDISTIVQAISRFGTVHALSSPRVTVLNNQAAVLSVAENFVYFKIDATREDNPDPTLPDTITVDSEAKAVPEGVIINVQPAIDLDTQTVSMALRPTVTKVRDTVSDPGVALLGIAGVESLVPVMNVQEVDSVVHLRSGEVAIMGGLLQDNTTSEDQGVPVLSEVPLLGAAFRNHQDHVSKTELVVFLKATILESGAKSIHQTDRELYRLFSQDRRPDSL